MMNITRLRGGNAQFPEERQVGDVVMLALGDIFCWDGGIWQLLGGRFLPQAMRETFLSYVSTGWPDAASAEFDLPSLLDLSVFIDYGSNDIVPGDPKMVQRFINRTVEVSRKCEERLLEEEVGAN
jgi:hypothetical protein